MEKVITKTMKEVKYLAIRPLKVSSQATDGRKKHQSGVKMHRVLIDEVYYKFTSDFEINKEETQITLSNNTPKELYMIHQNNGSIGVNVSAIVGENGSGKSTIVDHIIRIINNLSAALFGEYYYNSSSEHLHYIEEVYAELYVLIDHIVFCIVCEGAELFIKQYYYEKTEDNKDFFIFKETKKYMIDSKDPCQKNDECYSFLSKFCYTMIVNYSLYSFDTSLYASELTEDDKELKINEEGFQKRFTIKDFKKIKREAKDSNDRKKYIDAKSWLPGLLKKYDNYQRPILITPNRDNGQIEQRKEYIKGKERLLSLTLLRDKNNKRFYTHINNKEEIDKLTLFLDPVAAKRNYLTVFDDNFPMLPRTVLLALYNIVRNHLVKKFEIEDDSVFFNNPYKKAAWYYIVYEFFKIVLTYSELNIYKQSLLRITSRINTQTIKDIIEAIDKVCDIHSHVTRHFWRGLFYLKYDHLSNCVSDDSLQGEQTIVNKIDVESYSTKVHELVEKYSEIHYVDELLPPSIFVIDFEFFSINDKDKKNVIPFETLSSGEKQITLSLSTIYYFLTNLDSTSDKVSIISEDEDGKKQKDRIISYKHVCVIFDELELYYHPEMQRTFVDRLLSGLEQLDFKNIESIQFIMATHSPFILSDVSKTNVLFLDRDGHPQDVDNMHTFGANIHTMLKHSFFLKDGSIGAFAKKVIGDIEAYLNIHRICSPVEIYDNKKKIDSEELVELKDKDRYKFLDSFFVSNGANRQLFDYDLFCLFFPKERIKATIELFDEPIIKKVLKEDYYEVFPKERAKEELVVSLERQLADLMIISQSSTSGETDFIDGLISQINEKLKELKYE